MVYIFPGISSYIYVYIISHWFILKSNISFTSCIKLFIALTSSSVIVPPYYFMTLLYSAFHTIYLFNFYIPSGILISIFFMIFVHNYAPSLSSLKRIFKWTIIYFIVTIPTNYLVNSNYSYLRCKPDFPF